MGYRKGEPKLSLWIELGDESFSNIKIGQNVFLYQRESIATDSHLAPKSTTNLAECDIPSILCIYLSIYVGDTREGVCLFPVEYLIP